MLDITIVDSTSSEIISRIIRESFSAQAEILGITPETCSRFVGFESNEKVEQDIEDGSTAVLASIGPKPIGTIRYKLDSEKPGVGYIRRLAVLPEFRGNDYGEQLVAFAENRLQELGASVVELAIVAQFKKLRIYYERLEYQFKEFKEFETVPFDVLFMRKSL